MVLVDFTLANRWGWRWRIFGELSLRTVQRDWNKARLLLYTAVNR